MSSFVFYCTTSVSLLVDGTLASLTHRMVHCWYEACHRAPFQAAFPSSFHYLALLFSKSPSLCGTKKPRPTLIESFKSFNCANVTAMPVSVSYSKWDNVVHWAVMHKMKWHFVIMSLCYCWTLLDVTGWNAWDTLWFVVHRAQTCKLCSRVSINVLNCSVSNITCTG